MTPAVAASATASAAMAASNLAAARGDNCGSVSVTTGGVPAASGPCKMRDSRLLEETRRGAITCLRVSGRLPVFASRGDTHCRRRRMRSRGRCTSPSASGVDRHAPLPVHDLRRCWRLYSRNRAMPVPLRARHRGDRAAVAVRATGNPSGPSSRSERRRAGQRRAARRPDRRRPR